MRKIILTIAEAALAITNKIDKGLVLGLLAAAIGVGASAYTKEEVEANKSFATTTFFYEPNPASPGMDKPGNWKENGNLSTCGDGGNLCAITVDDDLDESLFEDILKDVQTEWDPSLPNNTPIQGPLSGVEIQIHKRD